MKRLNGLAILGLVGVGLWALMSQRHAPRTDLFCDFEAIELWDIAPEQGFTLALSTDHVTEGQHALKVTFPKADWPSINTKRLKQPMRTFKTLTLDVFNPQAEPVSFAIRMDDRARKRVTIERTLAPGMNHLQIAREEIHRRIDSSKLFFVVLFLDSVTQETTLYFDNMRLVAAVPSVSTDTLVEPSATPLAVPPSEQPMPLPEPAPVVRAPTSGALQIAVVKLREGASPQSLVSNGMPFAPGQLLSERDVAFFNGEREMPIATRVLARWPQDGSVRSLLVQFLLDIEATRGPITMRWGQPRTTQDLGVTEVTWDYPEGLLVVPAQWLCDSQVIGAQVPMGSHEFPAYDQRIRQFYPARRDDRLTGDIAHDGYYSTPHVFYQLYVRSGDPEIFLAARQEALAYRDTELIVEGPERGRHRQRAESRYIYVEALADDYLLTGDRRSREVAGYMAEYLRNHVEPAKAFYPKTATNFWTEREIAFPFLGVLAYYEISGDETFLKTAEQYMDNLYRMQRQWPGRGGFIHNLYAHDTDEGARPDEYGGSPFMTGLLLEAIVKYHRVTGSETAARSIFLALDWLMAEGLLPPGDTFVYLTSEAHRQEADEHPDLNFLIVHAFGYGYRLSGYARTDYLSIGRRILERGVRDAFLGDRKHFNQNFRSSGHFLAYVTPEIGLERGHDAAASSTDTPRPAPLDRRVLYAADFEYALDGWSAPWPGTVVEQDRSVAHSGTGSLKVMSTSPISRLSSGVRFETWFLDEHPTLQFAYKIPPGVPVGIRCQTEYGDWVYLGGTIGQPREGPAGQPDVLLTDDGQWHEITIDISQAIHGILPGVRALKEFQYFTHQDVGTDRAFWIDAFSIRGTSR